MRAPTSRHSGKGTPMHSSQQLETKRTPKRFYFLTALIYLPIFAALALIHARWYGYLMGGFSFAMLLWMRHTVLWQRFRIPLCFALAFLVAFFGLYWSRPQHDVSLTGQIGREGLRFFMNLPVDMNSYSQTLLGRNPSKPPEGYRLETPRLAHSRLELLSPKEGQSPYAVLQLHGGAFVSGLNELYMAFAKRYSDSLGGAMVASLDYRLWPPHDYPSQQQDTLEAWRYLTRTLGYAPENILVTGDSAGGTLALSLCLRLRDLGEPLPRALVAMSPWADLSNSGPSHLDNATRDPTFGVLEERYEGGPLGVPTTYATGLNLRDPYLSPSFGDYRGFPPMLLQASSNELLLSDSRVIYENALENGVDCTFTVYQDLFHVFQASLDLTPESRAAWGEIQAFLQRVFGL